MPRKLLALILALLFALGCAAPACAADGDVRLKLVALETSGVMVQLENYGVEMNMEFVFHADGTAGCVYNYGETSYDLAGTYTALGSGYEFTSGGFTATLLRNEEGYYVWAQDGVNELFLEVNEEGTPQIAIAPAALPDIVSTRRVPFPGTLDEHREALLFVGGMINEVTVEYAESGAFSQSLAWEKYAVRSEAENVNTDLYILYNTDGSGVCSYAYGVATSTLLGREDMYDMISGQSIIAIPAMAVACVETGFDENALFSALESFNEEQELDALFAATDAADGKMNLFSFSHYVTVLLESTGQYQDVDWFLFHNTSDSGEPAPTPSYAKTGEPEPEPKPEPVPAPSPAPSPAQQGAHWACPNCGAVNSGAKCLVCGTERPSAEPAQEPTPEPAPAPAQEGAHWACPNCGAVNSGKSCLVCGAARP